jgi:GNAT superfamily N-acetyltransferase
MKIRPIEADDLDAVAKMMTEFEAYLTKIHGKGRSPSFEKIRKDLVAADFGSGRFFEGLIAERNRQALGYLIYYIGFHGDARRGAMIMPDLFVRETARRNKVGQAFMAKAREIARKRGCKRMAWTVWNRNPAAIAFYLGLGAKPVDDEILMEWKIGRR